MKIIFSLFTLFLLSTHCKVQGDDNDGGGGSNGEDVRFNKFDVNNIDNYEHLLPLSSDSYPISANPDVVAMLKHESTAISVVNDLDDYEVIYDVDDLITEIGGLPDHPSTNKNAAYWKKLRKVINMRLKNQNSLASIALKNQMQLPLRWSDYTVFDVSEAVHDEYPGLHQAEFIEDLVTGKYGPVQFDYNIIPRRSMNQFLRGIVVLADINTWSVGVVGPHNFGAKWYAGRARPEEVVWKIKTGAIDSSSVPRKVLNKIERMNLVSAEAFTRYEEGSPRHPSWPAMHSAASNISFWLQVVMDLTDRQLCEAKKVDFAVAFARTVAGVHFEDDNIAGLNMGQIIVANAIPMHFTEKYNSDLSSVAGKVEAKRFNWNDYDPLEICPSSP